jgi:hypothetical protein
VGDAEIVDGTVMVDDRDENGEFWTERFPDVAAGHRVRARGAGMCDIACAMPANVATAMPSLSKVSQRGNHR